MLCMLTHGPGITLPAGSALGASPASDEHSFDVRRASKTSQNPLKDPEKTKTVGWFVRVELQRILSWS